MYTYASGIKQKRERGKRERDDRRWDGRPCEISEQDDDIWMTERAGHRHAVIIENCDQRRNREVPANRIVASTRLTVLTAAAAATGTPCPFVRRDHLPRLLFL